MFSNTIVDSVKKLLEKISKFVDACRILDENKIDESCHADFLSKIGYDVVWQDLNPDNTVIVK